MFRWKDESSNIKKVQILDYVKSNCTKEWFINCQNLTTLIEFTNLDVSNCVDFSFMFAYCESLQNLNELQNWNVFNGTAFSFIFANCSSLQEISLSNTLDILTKMMFYKCNPKLKIHWREHIYTYEDLLEYEKIY